MLKQNCHKCHIRYDISNFYKHRLICKSCHKKLVDANLRKYGGAVRSFKMAREMCNLRSHRDYASVGGIGIKFEFKNVQELVEHIGTRPQKTYLCRIDKKGNYCKGNVKWSSVLERNRNHRGCVLNSNTVSHIQKLYRQKIFTNQQLSTMFNIAPRTMLDAVKQVSWRQLDE